MTLSSNPHQFLILIWPLKDPYAKDSGALQSISKEYSGLGGTFQVFFFFFRKLTFLHYLNSLKYIFMEFCL